MSDIGLYRRGKRNTTSKELDKFQDKLLELDYRSKQVIIDELIDLINEFTCRAFEDGINSVLNK